MPFIKINDGSVHLTARDALWMDHSNLNSTQRSLLLNSAVNGIHYNGPPVYTQTPQQSDFFMDGQVLHRDTSSHVIAGSDRAQSPHHYHYAALTGGAAGMSTFYGGHQVMDDPSPYATTTLVMNSQQRWLKDHMLRAPRPPSNPVPSGPPPRFQDNLKHATLNDRRSPSVRSPPFVEAKMRTIGHHSGSPPHTDISYVQSSDGTGGSSNGRSKAGTLSGRRSPPKQTLMDMIPPPPLGAPPPESQIGRVKTMTDSTESHLLDVNEHYDAVSDALLFERDTRYTHEKPCAANNRPSSRSRIRDYRNGMSSGGGQDDDDSQRSSLMLDVNARSAFCSSSEADEENTEDDDDDDDCIRRRSSGRAERPQSPEYAAHRPSQPCMGVSASALTQSSYDGTSAVRSSSRLKSMPRTCKKDLV